MFMWIDRFSEDSRLFIIQRKAVLKMKFLIPLCLAAVASVGQSLKLTQDKHDILKAGGLCKMNGDCISKTCCIKWCSSPEMSCQDYLTSEQNTPGTWIATRFRWIKE